MISLKIPKDTIPPRYHVLLSLGPPQYSGCLVLTVLGDFLTLSFTSGIRTRPFFPMYSLIQCV